MGNRSFENTPEFYRNILDTLPLTLAVLNKSGEIVEANQQWDQFGRDNDINPTFLDQGTNYLEVCRKAQDEYAQNAYQGLKGILEGDESEFTMEYPCHGESEKRWFLMKARPLKEERRGYMLVVHLDITERVLSERELRHKEKLASIGEMSAGIMHEINNPNAFISGNVDYLLKRIDDLDPDRRAEFLEECRSILQEIKSGSNRIKRIVNKVEQFAQKQTAEETETSLEVLGEVLGATVEQVKQAQSADFIRVKNQPSADWSNRSVALSEDEFQSIVKNLVTNAVVAVRERDPEAPEVLVGMTLDNTTVTLCVMDNGVGIDEDTMPNVRDPFFTTGSISDGTGLGLSIVTNLTRKADGEFELYSSPGEGTWAFIEIPVIVSD